MERQGMRLIALIVTAGMLADLRNDAPSPWRLVDAGFEQRELAQSPMSGWYSDDARTGRLKASGVASLREQGERSLLVELVRPRRIEEGMSSISQVVTLRPGGEGKNVERDLEFGLKLRAVIPGRLSGGPGAARIVFYTWDEKQRAQPFAKQTVPLVEDRWMDISVPLTVPEGHERFGVFVYLPGHSGGRFWLDDASLKAR